MSMHQGQGVECLLRHRLLLLKPDTQPQSHLLVEVCIKWGMDHYSEGTERIIVKSVCMSLRYSGPWKRHVYFTPPPPTWHPTPSMWHASFAARIGWQMVPPICLSSFNNRSLWLRSLWLFCSRIGYHWSKEKAIVRERKNNRCEWI